MTQAKHTPGPWMYEAEEGFCSMIISEDGDIVCQFDQDPKEANARLIAAAPELLEALKLGLEYWQDRQQRYSNRSPVWVQKASSAIAKAKGSNHD